MKDHAVALRVHLLPW